MKKTDIQKHAVRVGMTLAAWVATAAMLPTLPALAADTGTGAATPVKKQAVPLGFSVQNMDRSVSPRKDFYRYAAGRWLDRTQIPASETEASSFYTLADNLNQQLQKIITDAAAAPAGSLTGSRQQIGDFYRSAMDLPRLDALGLKPIEADLQKMQKLDSPAALSAFAASLQLRYGASPLINAAVSADPKDSAMNVLFILPGIQALDQSDYTQPDGQRLRDQYVDFIARMFQAAGDAPEAAQRQARTVLSIETEMIGAQLTPLQKRDPNATYHKLPLVEVQALVPALDVRVFITALGMTPPETMLVPDLAGIRAVQSVLSKYSAADLQTLLRWHVLSGMTSRLGQPYYGIDQAFTRQRLGLQASEPRAKEITKTIGSQLAHPLSQLYVQTYFPESTKREIQVMVGHIRSEFEERLRRNPWLDAPTRTAALEKLSRIDIQVGYPEKWIDYSSVQIKADDFFGNIQRINAFSQQRDFAQLGKPVVRERFAFPNKTTPIAVNAAYMSSYNAIDITAAIVQPPFYVPGADLAVNYCTIGAVIGHEITHGFDSMGRLYGPAGNLRDWWTPQANAQFKARTDVLVKQFSAPEVLPGLRHNGALTVTENTADLGGITLAYAALQRELGGKPQPKINGMTPDQRCFAAWSQLWMSKARPERVRVLVATDGHSLSALRAAGPLVHLAPFYKAFGIRKGDPMWRAPKDRVQIW